MAEGLSQQALDHVALERRYLRGRDIRTYSSRVHGREGSLRLRERPATDRASGLGKTGTMEVLALSDAPSPQAASAWYRLRRINLFALFNRRSFQDKVLCFLSALIFSSVYY